MLVSFLAETSADVRLSDNLLNHAQITYGIGPEPARAERHRARFGIEAAPNLMAAISGSGLARANAAALTVPRLLTLASEDPSLEGLRRALTQPRRASADGKVALLCNREILELDTADLELVWRACEHLHAAHYGAYWESRKPVLESLALEVEEQLRAADVPHKLAELTAREPPHADIEVYLLDSEALISYSGSAGRVCITTTALSRPERFMYLFAHECARLYLHNPPWWEVEPCASICTGLADATLEAVEACAAQYLAATLVLRYGSDPGFWMVHPRLEEAIARHWPQFVAAPEKGIDLLLERVLRELRGADLGAAAVRPRRLSVTYDESGHPVRCSVAPQRY
jgi:hypothetical protein